MANKKTREVWAGPGVLSLGRRKIAIGEDIPKDLESKARKSLREKGMIVDKIIEPKDEPVDLAQAALDADEAADEAEALAEKAVADSADLVKKFEEAKQATSTAKGLNTKAQKAAKAADATDEIRKAAEEALNTFEAAKAASDKLKADLPDIAKLTENAVRLRMESDRAAAAADAAE